jgi:hypothetical protein
LSDPACHPKKPLASLETNSAALPTSKGIAAMHLAFICLMSFAGS